MHDKLFIVTVSISETLCERSQSLWEEFLQDQKRAFTNKGNSKCLSALPLLHNSQCSPLVAPHSVLCLNYTTFSAVPLLHYIQCSPFAGSHSVLSLCCTTFSAFPLLDHIQCSPSTTFSSLPLLHHIQCSPFAGPHSVLFLCTTTFFSSLPLLGHIQLSPFAGPQSSVLSICCIAFSSLILLNTFIALRLLTIFRHVFLYHLQLFPLVLAIYCSPLFSPCSSNFSVCVFYE